jgi:hypothetical protein
VVSWIAVTICRLQKCGSFTDPWKDLRMCYFLNLRSASLTIASKQKILGIWQQGISRQLSMTVSSQLLPRDRHNERGELVFDMHPAKLLLREDVKNGVHRRMTPDYMHRSTRPEYKLFKGEIFRHRIYQEVRLQKYFNYLELKRTKESPTRRRETRERREAQFAAPSPSEQQQHPSIAAMDLNN